MGEIRSTMDIIMERARGLTVTDEEKREFRERELTGRVRGLIQRFLDGLSDIDRFREGIAPLEERDRDMTRRTLRNQCLELIIPGQDNEPVLEILEKVAGIEVTSVRFALEDFVSKLDRLRKAREKKLMERLAARGISGSAVMPNPEAGPEWAGMVMKVREEFEKRISSLPDWREKF